MSDKLLDVIDTICTHPGLITDVVRTGSEYYFRFKKHTMSVFKRENESEFGEYALYIYPGHTGDLAALGNLLQFEAPEAAGVAFTAYQSADYDNEAFKRLYRLLENKYLNIDYIFDDILAER